MITINIDQDRLDRARSFENSGRAAQDPPLPAFSQEEFVEQMVNAVIDRKLSQADATAADEVAAAFTNATEEKKQEVKEILDLAPPSP